MWIKALFTVNHAYNLLWLDISCIEESNHNLEKKLVAEKTLLANKDDVTV